MFLKERTAKLLMRRALKAHFADQDPAPVIAAFFDSSLTTIYHGVYSHPTEERPGYLNRWRGPVLEPKEGDCTLIMAFLLDVICDGDVEAFQYLLNWLAHLLQRPEEKPGIAIILLGGQGLGKGTLARILHRIFGDSFILVNQIDRVVGHFNGILERSYVLFMDDVSYGDRKQAEAQKSLITEPTVTINEKHQPVRQVASFHRFIIAANAEHLKHTDRDDRRDFVLKVSDRHQGDVDFWDALYAELEGDGTAAFMHQLLQRDISGVNIRQRPITKALREQKLLSLDAIGEWWLDRLHAGYIRDPESGWSDFEPSDDLRAMVMEYAGVQSHRGLSLQIIVRRLTQMCPSIRKAQRALIPGAVRRRGLELPSLEVARKEFEAYIRHPVDWED